MRSTRKIMATKKNLTLSQHEGQPHLKPYCQAAKEAAERKSIADELRAKATVELRAKLDSDPETKDFTGTVVCIYDDQVYKIRVQRPASCNWRDKRLQDPKLKEYKALMKDIDFRLAYAKELEEFLSQSHPKCVDHGFTIAFMNK